MFTSNMVGIKLLPRYKLLKASDTEFYLVDLEKNILGVFFPLIQPLLPKPMYRISDIEYSELKSEISISRTESTPITTSISMGFVSFLIGRMLPQSVGSIHSLVQNLAIFIAYTILIVGLRIFFHRTPPYVQKIKKRQPKLAQLSPYNSSNTFLGFMSLLGLLSFGIFTYTLFTVSVSHISYHILNAIFLLAYFICGMSFYNPKEYKVRFLG